MSSSVYNTTDGPLLIDGAGRVLGARERLDDVDVDASPISGHLRAGRLVTVEASPADDDTADTAEPVEAAPAVEAAPPSKAPRKPRATTNPDQE